MLNKDRKEVASSSRLKPATLRSTSKTWCYTWRCFLISFFRLSSTQIQWLSGRIEQRPSGGRLFVAWGDPNQHPNSSISWLRLQHCASSACQPKLTLDVDQGSDTEVSSTSKLDLFGNDVGSILFLLR